MFDGDYIQVLRLSLLSPVEIYLITFLFYFQLKLIALTCSRPSEDRTIPSSVIAERTKLSIENVEHLLMKSLSVSSREKTM